MIELVQRLVRLGLLLVSINQATGGLRLVAPNKLSDPYHCTKTLVEVSRLIVGQPTTDNETVLRPALMQPVIVLLASA